MGDSAAVVDWLTAIGTIGAVIVALGVALSEPWRQRRREERAQARAVHAWVSYRRDPQVWQDKRDWGLLLFNGSTRPVFDVEARVELHGELTEPIATLDCRYDEPLLPTGTDGALWWSPANLSDAMKTGLRSDRLTEQTASVTLAAFSFTDADSRRWIVREGRLERS